MNASLTLALLTLAPVLTGPPPAESASITAKLCNGGTITIPIGDDNPRPDQNCHPKGCHAGTCREKEKRKN
ncbi:hypothetical protein [Erythrobacter dokdonensis]|uniref:Uncharacterized protein n=1 Tax=Erythrobacter dokdonensis DSW-74 TaxID=1300349 RepID=A0A1A7BC09_9SPHN|nr:hypothetical protein [Erythrobacter dokdonensis]MEE4316441.1 hypothetical protein [Erythrobacter sp.]OBV10034.1 hypothetical protein I603_2595 [Erythrobacter dokdonensis DSW-74]